MKNPFFLLSFLSVVLFACNSANSNKSTEPQKDKATVLSASNDTSANASAAVVRGNGPVADAATIIARQQVPIICYHQIRDWRPTDSKVAKDYIIPPAVFQAQIKMLADSGYHTILLDQMYNYLAYGTPLPSKPVMLTFDDTDEDQFTIGAPTLEKYGFKGVFFIMTVSLNKLPHYMTKDQVKELSQKGHDISSHTWDHHMFSKFATPQDWDTQVDKPKKQIEEITGKPAPYFAFPYGVWNQKNLPELKKHGILAAYQLAEKRDPNDPLLTIRRILGSGYWDGPKLAKIMRQSF
jgi:peptidoglycan/xylan/chitin deacetylase (PgdA/CDA1 family)